MGVQRRPQAGTKLKKGQRPKWVVRYRPYPGAKEQSKTFSYSTHKQPEKAAKDFDADQRARIARGTWIDPDDEATTLGQLVEEWVDQAHNPGTRGVRAGLLANLGKLEDMPIGRIRSSNVTDWVATLRRGRPWKGGKPLADITVEMHLGRLKGIFDRAVEDGMLGRTPVPASLRKTAMAGKSIDVRAVPTPDDVKRMCAAADAGGTLTVAQGNRKRLSASPWLSMVIRLGVDTGLRVGEVSGLLWRDIDLDARTLRVERQCINRFGAYSGLKTKRSRRTVPLSNAMVRELADWRRGDDDPVVPGATGRGTSSQDLSRRMRMVGDVAGLGDRLSRFHGLRHLYASSLLAAGEPITTVAALIGDTVQTTSGVYAHWLPGAQEAARSSVNSLAGSVRDQGASLRVV